MLHFNVVTLKDFLFISTMPSSLRLYFWTKFELVSESILRSFEYLNYTKFCPLKEDLILLENHLKSHLVNEVTYQGE